MSDISPIAIEDVGPPIKHGDDCKLLAATVARPPSGRASSAGLTAPKALCTACRRAASIPASAILARRRCTLSPHSTGCPACAASSDCSKGGDRARQPAQRAARADADRQHRRRPGDLPPAERRAADRDTEGWARGASAWVRTATSSETVGADAAVELQAARTHPGQIATLILPSDTSWVWTISEIGRNSRLGP